jgi:hypothetical protein
LAIVLSVFLRFTPSDCPFAIFWSLYCLSFFDLRLLIAPSDLRLLIAPLLSFGHCIVCLSSIYAFWLPLLIYAFWMPLCYLLADRQYNGQKIAKGQSEGVNRKKTDNTMAKRDQRGNQKA